MIRRQTELASIETWIKSIMAALFRLDKKLPIFTLVYIAGMVIFFLTPADDSAGGRAFLAFTPFVQNSLLIPEYMLLFLLFSLSLVTFNVSIRKASVSGIIFCVAFAALDEFLQSFMPGRETSVVNLSFDIIGALAGYCIIQYYLYMTFSGKWE